MKALLFLLEIYTINVTKWKSTILKNRESGLKVCPVSVSHTSIHAYDVILTFFDYGSPPTGWRVVRTIAGPREPALGQPLVIQP